MEKKPYECEAWLEKFSMKNDLTRHMKTHADEKPYEFEELKSDTRC